MAINKIIKYIVANLTRNHHFVYILSVIPKCIQSNNYNKVVLLCK